MTSFVTKEKHAEMKVKYEEWKRSFEGEPMTEGVYVHVVVSSDDYLEGSHGKLLSEDENLRDWYDDMKRSIRESSKYARGALLNERGQTIWEEPLDEYEKRMEFCMREGGNK